MKPVSKSGERCRMCGGRGKVRDSERKSFVRCKACMGTGKRGYQTK